jgi:two-component system OmpR family sensor kinase
VLLAALLAAWLARRTVRPMADTIAMQRRFVADASHELRTPLTLLSTRAQLLSRRLHRDPRLDDRLSAQVVADVDGVVADTRTLREILDELLTAADSRGQAAWTTVEVNGLVEEVAAAAAAAAERSGVTLAVDPSPEAAAVEGSVTALRRALTALVDNAVDHARTSVTISVHTHRRRVDVVVGDDGSGIPEEIAPRLFDRFTSLRAETPSPDGHRHYGLGLALVADVAANHHGRVAVANRDDGRTGAVFTVSLPGRRVDRHRWLGGAADESTARAASSRATGIRNGEQET